MSRWRNAYAGESWSKCQTCGQDFPSSLVWYNPRFGWQCHLCWDGLVHRDQILPPIFPGEGTRRTPAPLTNTATEGIDTAAEAALAYTFFDHADRSIVYLITDGDPPTFAPSSGDAVGGWNLDNHWCIYIRNGSLMFSSTFVPEVIPVPTVINWQVIGGELQYTV